MVIAERPPGKRLPLCKGTYLNAKHYCFWSRYEINRIRNEDIEDYSIHIFLLIFQQVSCPQSCNTHLVRSQLQSHQCPNELKECQICEKMYCMKDMEAHLLDCPEVEIVCSNGCKTSALRRLMNSHLQRDCPRGGVPCDYGCGTVRGIIMSKRMINLYLISQNYH